MRNIQGFADGNHLTRCEIKLTAEFRVQGTFADSDGFCKSFLNKAALLDPPQKFRVIEFHCLTSCLCLYFLNHWRKKNKLQMDSFFSLVGSGFLNQV